HPQALTQPQILDQPAQAADQRARQGIAGDAADVVPQQHPPQPPAMALLRGNRQGQRTHQPAAHADAMATAEQPEGEGGEKQRQQLHAQVSSPCGWSSWAGVPASRAFRVADRCAGSSSSNRMLWAGLSRSSYCPLLTAQLKTQMAMITSTMATGTRM